MTKEKKPPRHSSRLLPRHRDRSGRSSKRDAGKSLSLLLSSSHLSFSVWCGLAFLIHSSGPVLGLSDEEGSDTDQINRTFPGVCNDTKQEFTHDAGTKGCNVTYGILTDVNASNGTNSSTSHQEPENSRLCRPSTYGLDDILRSLVGYPPLICQSHLKPPKKQEQHQQPGKLLNPGFYHHHHHHHTYLNFEEFRSTRSREKGLGIPTWFVNITHRLEPDGTEYNYASALKGAKVVAHNKESKGASNILGKDHDKYLRNPCSVGVKFVVIELTEETLVDAVRIANFEHYSSNFKDFELSGSLSYPTETWTPLGKFVADNVKHIQSFKLPEPKWLRYLKLSLLSHYGSEFYCTLSVLEVYGIDAIERMLEDLIVVSPPEPNSTLLPSQSPEAGSAEKVRSLELNLSVLEEYIKELNEREGEVLPELDREISRMSVLLEKEETEIRDIMKWKEITEKGIADFVSWKSFVLSQVEALDRENSMLRSEIEKVARYQTSLESKELAVLASKLRVSSICGFPIVFGFSVLFDVNPNEDSPIGQSQAKQLGLVQTIHNYLDIYLDNEWMPNAPDIQTLSSHKDDYDRTPPAPAFALRARSKEDSDRIGPE
ncbi:hypothetical protein CRG98_027907 [Punica granatum]|uniref:SUN domain-containing protein n=1 Tax=Punica granatum TaxID=22663 RepID=A0A2I0J694_PUNGR|nr:hypothetical protein CRG98_027907 [Punica granatum]